MRKALLLAAVIGVVMAVGLGFGYAQTAAPGYAQGGWYCPWHNQAMERGYVRQNTGGWYCPWMGGGYQQGQARSTGYHGMMGHGGCISYGRGYRGWGPGSQYHSGHNDSSP